MIFKIFTAFFGIVILASSCEKPKTKVKSISEITMKVNTVDWKASNNEATYVQRFGDAGPNAGFYEDDYEMSIFGLQVNGTDSSVLRINFEKKPGITGEYLINYSDPEAYAFFYANMEDYYFERNDIYNGSTGTGLLKITEYNQQEGIISGTFHFELKPNQANAGKTSFLIVDGNINKLRRYLN